MDEALNQLAAHVAASTGGAVTGTTVRLGELTLETTPGRLLDLLGFLKKDARCGFAQLVTICGADYPGRERRFEVVYHLLSLKLNHRVRVKLATDEDTPVPSAAPVYESAPWFERETWDMYGVWFSDHPDLRRILTDYGFEGHPLRKDFPLTGFVEMRYDEQQKRVVYEPVKLTQEFRRFDFLSPWEGAKYVLPGDEKATKA